MIGRASQELICHQGAPSEAPTPDPCGVDRASIVARRRAGMGQQANYPFYFALLHNTCIACSSLPNSFPFVTILSSTFFINCVKSTIYPNYQSPFPIPFLTFSLLSPPLLLSPRSLQESCTSLLSPCNLTFSPFAPPFYPQCPHYHYHSFSNTPGWPKIPLRDNLMLEEKLKKRKNQLFLAGWSVGFICWSMRGGGV